MPLLNQSNRHYQITIRNIKTPTTKIVLRCYESLGNQASLALTGDLNLQVKDELNCLEEMQYIYLDLSIQPWQVKTFRLKQSS